MKRALLPLVALIAIPSVSPAGYTDTVPQGVFLLDARYGHSDIRQHWGNDGKLGPLMSDVVRYEAGGGLQGILIANARASYDIFVSLLGFGVTDDVTLFLGLPLVLNSTIDPELGWVEGDYSVTLGRRFSEEDFWAWAGSMGQPKPGSWKGNHNTPGDFVLGTRWRFSDRLSLMQEWGLDASVSLFGSIRTGTAPDADEIVSAGTASWNLHSQGEAGIHLAVEKKLLGERVTVGIDLFREVFFKGTYRTPTGTIHPLLLNQAPYAGETYELDPGDFTGFEVGVDLEVWRGPRWRTWLTQRDPSLAAKLPPLLLLNLRYKFTGIGQSDWKSDSALWDWDNEKFWAPGYKNILTASATVSLLRVGVPLQINATYRNQTLLPGKNSRAPVVYFVGVQAPLKFW